MGYIYNLVNISNYGEYSYWLIEQMAVFNLFVPGV